MTEPRLKDVIAIVNAKGGVGKTTTAQNIAAGIVRFRKDSRVLIIDLDAQGNASYLMGWERRYEGEGKQTIYDALRAGSKLPIYNATTNEGKIRRGLYYTPSSKYLELVDTELFRAMQPKKVLASCFRRGIINCTNESDLQSIMDFDYIIIDCPPAMSQVTYNALSVASSFIIPLPLEGLAYDGMSKLIEVYRDVKEELNPDLELMGVLKVMAQDRLNTTKGLSAMLSDQFEEKVFNTRIRRSNKINESQCARQHIFEYAPNSPAGIDYGMLVKEILEVIEKD